MLRRLLQFLFLDKKARQALKGEPAKLPARKATAAARRRPAAAAPPPPPQKAERTSAQALAEAEERMARLPPEKAQMVRVAMAVHRASQAALDELDDEQREKLKALASKAFLGK